MKFAEGFLFEYPGLPSVSVCYIKTNDYFFSGHVGLPIILAMESRKLGFKFMPYICWIIALIEFIILTLVRTHYIIDLITGIIVAHYIFIIIDEYILEENKINFVNSISSVRKWFNKDSSNDINVVRPLEIIIK